MEIKSFLELKSRKPHKVEYLKTWLSDNKNYCTFLIHETSCIKWSRWLEDKSMHIFPCVCSIREQNCIFIETYYNLGKIVELHKKENYFHSLVSEYKLIADNKNAVLDWFKKYHHIASNLIFDSEIDIMLELEPYRRLKIKLDIKEFQGIIEFQNIFYEIENN